MRIEKVRIIKENDYNFEKTFLLKNNGTEKIIKELKKKYKIAVINHFYNPLVSRIINYTIIIKEN